MQRPQPETVTLDDILITEELSRRSRSVCAGKSLRPPNLLSENQALHSLARQLVNQPETMLQSLVDIALDLCNAGTAGVSLLETTPNGEEIFRWNVLAGTWEQYVGGTTPRNFSPCGVCLDRGTPVLFSHPERYFTYFQAAKTLIVEGLVLPLIADNHALGTIWITSHDDRRHFDAEDVRVMTSLADFTAAALLLNQRQAQELLAKNAQLEAEAIERGRAEESARESAANFRATIENLPGGAAFIVDRNLRYLLAEGEALHAAGFQPEDLVGKTIFEVLPPELATYYEPMYHKALAGEPFEHEHTAHDRTYVSRGTPLYSADGAVYAVLAVSYDITDRKQVEEALRESEEQFRAFVNASSDIVYKMSADWSVMHNLVGKQFIASTVNPKRNWIDEYIPEDEQPQVWAAIESAIRTKSNFELEHRVFRGDGTLGWTFSRAIPLLDEGGEIVEWFGAASDVTERKQAEAALRESEAKYRSLFNSMDEGYFLCDVIFDENDRPIDLFYIDENPAAIRMTGQSFREQRFREISPNYEEYWYEIFGRVAQTGQGERLERYAEPDQIWYDFYVFKVGSDDQGRVAVVFNDITDRKQRELNTAFLDEIGKALSVLSTPDEIIQTVGVRLGKFLQASGCIFADVDEAKNEATIHHGWNTADVSSLKQTFRLADYFGEEFLRAGRAGEAVIVCDTGHDERANAEAYAQLQIGSFVTVPFQRDGRWTANITVTTREPRDWRVDEIELLQEIVNRVFPRIERARAEAAVRESELQRVREQSAREQERQRAEALAELDRAKTLFFSNVSHEFRTPLTLLLASLQDALSDCATVQPSDRTYPLAQRQRERLELAQRNAIRLLKLVNTLLDFSRIEAGRMEAVYEPTDLALFTTELASVFRSAIERAGLRLIVECPPLPELVYVDRQMWEKIVLNLLSNAFKFTLEGEIAVRLHLADGDAGKRNGRTDRVMLQIQDTGTGIPPEELPHVFERFHQVRSTKARTHEGSGIGLALVHELIRLHGGTVDVSSTLGQGSCFTITIPLGRAHLPSVSVSEAVATLGASAGRDSAHRLRSPTSSRITATRTQASTTVGAAPYVEEVERWLPEEGNREQGTGNREELSTPPDLDPPQPPRTKVSHIPPLIRGARGVRGENLLKVPLFKGDLGGSPGLKTVPTPSPVYVLLVDDNADMREYLTRILSEHVQVEAVADGASALAAAQERVPDLVLTDVMMPELDGFELLKALRANPRTREVPIILLSARAGEDSVVEGLEAGADDYLIKPFSAQQLVSRVNGHLQMAQLRLAALHQERTINRRKDELLSTVSHELNTPLVAILGWTRLLRTNPSNQSMLMKSLETIERNATLQAKLIQDLLDISRISAGKLRLSLEPVELESVIETAIASINHLAQAKQIDLVWWGVTGQQSDILAPSNIERVLVQGDRDRLQQIITNLLTNAIKFTLDRGSINVELSVIERHNGSDASYAEISITDTGIGISAEFLPQVFDRFRQAQESSSSKGLGLGLAIARHLVELHNGTIRAESAGVGQGATFVVRLPLMPH